MLDILKNEKLLCAVAGAAAIVVGKKVLKSEKTRNLAVTGLAKGMKLQLMRHLLQVNLYR